MVALLRVLFTLFLLLCAATLVVVVPVAPALADDDGGSSGGGASSGGGGGGSDSSGGGDPWQPFAKSAKSSKVLKCRCGGFLGLQCSCRSVRAGRGSRSTAAATGPRIATEILAVGLSEAEIATLSARGFRVMQTRTSRLLGTAVSRLQVPRGASLPRALGTARSVAPGGRFAENTLFDAARPTFQPAGSACGHNCTPFVLTRWRSNVSQCSARAVIGVIDTGVDTAHPVFASSRVEVITTRSSDREPSGKEHGTGVVSLLVGEASGEFGGAAPGARVVAVDAFHRSARSDSADTHDLIAALDHLADRGVRLINLSFSGVDNPILREAIEQLSRSGVTLVAAVGAPRAGDAAGFPARYPGVTAVASVDGKMRTGLSSIRGSHVAFAAPGNGIIVATASKGYVTVEGSSFAAPFVTAALAMALQAVSDGDQAVRLMASGAMDLGAPGRDPVFGWGLIQYSALPPC